MPKIKKLVPIQKKQQIKKKGGKKNIALEYMGDIDDKRFKKYSTGENFSSFINEFKEDEEKVVKELKNINNLIEHGIDTDEDSEYIRELFDLVNAINYFLYEYSKKRSGLKILTPKLL